MLHSAPRDDMPRLNAVDIGRNCDYAMGIMTGQVGIDAAGGDRLRLVLRGTSSLQKRRADAGETIGLHEQPKRWVLNCTHEAPPRVGHIRRTPRLARYELQIACHAHAGKRMAADPVRTNVLVDQGRPALGRVDAWNKSKACRAWRLYYLGIDCSQFGTGIELAGLPSEGHTRTAQHRTRPCSSRGVSTSTTHAYDFRSHAFGAQVRLMPNASV